MGFVDNSVTNMATLKEKVYTAARDGMAITIFAMLCQKDPVEVKEVLDHETEEGGQRTTPLIIAARNGHEKVVRMLLTQFKVNVEQVGTVKFDGYVIEGATALWCSAGAGHFDVVKTLLELGSNVNHPTYTNSTPLRAACFDGRLDIVRYLIEHKADVRIANKYNNTCLMIACYKGHKEVVTYLLEMGAPSDAKAHCGATALHFSSECGHLEIVRELVRFGASMLPNDHGMTPLHIAAESSRAEIVEYFISLPTCSREKRVEALELLGASYANDKDHYDVNKAYHYLWLAMQERFSEANSNLYKPRMSTIAAYENRRECQTVEDLEAIKDNHNALHMEALVIRERILGEDNPEIPHPVIFRGAVFADTARFDRCTALWMHAMKLRQKNSRTITKDLLRFAQVFSQMVHVGVKLDFSLCCEVFEHALNELDRDLHKIHKAHDDEKEGLKEIFEANIHTVIYLLVILTKVKVCKDEEIYLCKLIYKLNKLPLRLSDGYTPLHMVVDAKTVVDDFHVNDIVKFPNSVVMQLLARCGAKVNAVDVKQNTPLHIIVTYTKPISDFLTLHNIICGLADSGAHIDMCNGEGKTPSDMATTGVAEIILRTKRNMSLKCSASRAVRKYKLNYKGHVPLTLEEFIEMH